MLKLWNIVSSILLTVALLIIAALFAFAIITLSLNSPQISGSNDVNSSAHEVPVNMEIVEFILSDNQSAVPSNSNMPRWYRELDLSDPAFPKITSLDPWDYFSDPFWVEEFERRPESVKASFRYEYPGYDEWGNYLGEVGDKWMGWGFYAWHSNLIGSTLVETWDHLDEHPSPIIDTTSNTFNIDLEDAVMRYGRPLFDNSFMIDGKSQFNISHTIIIQQVGPRHFYSSRPNHGARGRGANDLALGWAQKVDGMVQVIGHESGIVGWVNARELEPFHLVGLDWPENIFTYFWNDFDRYADIMINLYDLMNEYITSNDVHYYDINVYDFDGVTIVDYWRIHLWDPYFGFIVPDELKRKFFFGQ